MPPDLIHVLLIEDDLDDALLLREAVRHPGKLWIDLTHATRLATGLTYLEQGGFDLILLDLSLPDSYGLDTLREVHARFPHIPIVVLSALHDEDLAVRAIQEGAQDYLVKLPDNGAHLTRSIRYALERARSLARLRGSQRSLYAALDTLPMQIALLDEKGAIVAVNSAWRRVSGGGPWWGGEYVVGKNYLALLEGVGETSAESRDAIRGIRRVLAQQEESFSIEYRCACEKQERWFIMRAARSVVDGVPRVVITHEEITQRKRTEEALERRDAILEAVAFAAERFLRPRISEEIIDEALAHLGVATGVSRVYIFEMYLGADGEIRSTQRHEWVARGITPQIDNPIFADFSPRQHGFDRWLEQLSQGKVIQGHVRNFPAREQALLLSHDVRSILVVPIFVEEEWWGLIGLDECLTEREWYAAETEALRVAASTLGAALRRRRAEQALRESEERYRMIVETAQEGIWLVDNWGRTSYVNERMAEMLGYTVEEMLGRRFPEFLAAPIEVDLQGGLEQYFQQIQGQHDLRLRHREGKELLTLVSANPVLGASGEFMGVLGMLVDMTERKRAEEGLRAADRRALDQYSQLLDRLATLAQTVGTASNLTEVYRALLDFVLVTAPCNGLFVSHYDNESQMRRCMYAWAEGREEDVSALPPLPLGPSPHSRAIATGEVIICDDLQASLEGQQRVQLGFDVDDRVPRSAIAVPMTVLGRVIGGFEIQSIELGAYKEEHVTAMKMAANLAAIATENVRLLEQERRLRIEAQASEQRFRGLVQNAGDVVLILDRQGVIRYESPAIERILGYTPEERVGRSAFELMHPEDAPAVRRTFLRLIRQPGTTRVIECRLRHKNGSWRILEVTGSNLLDHPAVAGLVVNMRDITERRRHQRELEAIVAIASALRCAQRRMEMPPLVLNELVTLLQADAAALVMQDPATGKNVVEWGVGEWAGATGEALPRGRNVSEQVIETGQPYVSDTMSGDVRLSHPEMHSGLSAACVPLVANDQTLGTLWVGRRQALADHEVRLLAACGDIAANAIHRATLHEQTEQRLQQLACLRAIDATISSSLNLAATLEVFLEQVTAHLQVDAAIVLHFNVALKRLEHVADRGFMGKAFRGQPLPLHESYAGKAALERRPLYVMDRKELEYEAFRRAMEEEGLLSYYALPLVAKGQVQGVLELFHREPLSLDPEWLDFLQTLAAQAAIAIDNANLYKNLQRSNNKLSRAYDATIEGWSRALDLRDKETEGHSARVTEMTLRLARHLGMSEEELLYIRWGALMHDIGKMGVPDGILLKPGPLTEQEWEIMRRHPIYAYELLSSITFLRPALDIPFCHHERWDGTGYPRGLKGEEIPLAARIFAVVDVWDALRSDRPYRKGWPEEQVIAYIRRQAGSHFDPTVVETFLQLLRGE